MDNVCTDVFVNRCDQNTKQLPYAENAIMRWIKPLPAKTALGSQCASRAGHSFTNIIVFRDEGVYNIMFCFLFFIKDAITHPSPNFNFATEPSCGCC